MPSTQLHDSSAISNEDSGRDAGNANLDLPDDTDKFIDITSIDKELNNHMKCPNGFSNQVLSHITSQPFKSTQRNTQSPTNHYSIMQAAAYSASSPPASSYSSIHHAGGFYPTGSSVSPSVGYTTNLGLSYAATSSSSSTQSHSPSIYAAPYPSFGGNPTAQTAFPQGLDYPYNYGASYNYYGGGQGYGSSSTYHPALSHLTSTPPDLHNPSMNIPCSSPTLSQANHYSPQVSSSELNYSHSLSPPSQFFGEKRSSKNGRGRGRKAATGMQSMIPIPPSVSPIPDQPMGRVFIWDLDETIIMLDSLCEGRFPNNQDIYIAKECGHEMKELVHWLAEKHLFFGELHECDQVNVEDVSTEEQLSLRQQHDPSNPMAVPLAASATALCLNEPRAGGIDWMRNLAARYKRIKETYTEYGGNVGQLLSASNRQEDWLKLRQKIEDMTDKWLTYAQCCLRIIHRRPNCTNVLLSSNPLLIALSKLLLFGLADFFPIENVFSSNKHGRENCFERVQTKFGKKNCTFVAIGNSKDDEASCDSLHIPFWRVGRHEHLETLYYVLGNTYL